MSRRFIDDQDKHIYSIWKGMNKRCNNKNCKDYKWYGGKGIKVCDEWSNYLNFRNWALSHGFAKGLTIDRIESHKDYEPSNCQWITQSENSKKMQQQREGKIIIEYNGESHGLAEWSHLTGINQTTLLSRIRSGWSVERTLTERVVK